MKDSRNYESEFSSNDILINMRHNIFKNYTTYDPLSINKEYLTHRSSIFKLMQKIIIKFGFKSQTFFLTAYYLDIIFIKKKKINFNYYKIGLACLCLSSKFCENDPIVPHLQYFVRLYNSITGYKTTTPSTSNNTWYKISIDLIDDECTFKLYDMSGALLRTDIKTLPHLDNNYTMYYGVSCGYDSGKTKWYRKIKAIKL